MVKENTRYDGIGNMNDRNKLEEVLHIVCLQSEKK